VPVPCSQTPVGPPHQAVTVVRHGPRIAKHRGLRRLAKFRGSVAGPWHSLFTLRRLRYHRTTQNSLPGAGQALPHGLAYPQGLNERFPSCFLHLFPLSQAFLTQLAFWQEVQACKGDFLTRPAKARTDPSSVPYLRNARKIVEADDLRRQSIAVVRDLNCPRLYTALYSLVEKVPSKRMGPAPSVRGAWSSILLRHLVLRLNPPAILLRTTDH
jgi:hypothetical protein